MTHSVIDWALLLEELRLSSLTFRDIATAVDVNHTSLIKYSQQATSPSHATGERLIAFWMQTTGKTRDQLPTALVVKKVTSMSA